MFPILLSEEILPKAVFYGTIVPVLAYICTKTFIINPYNEKMKQMETDKVRDEHKEKLLQKRREAEAVVSLLLETHNRIVQQEESKNGLVIEKAIFGKADLVAQTSLGEGDVSASLELLDVIIPIQCLVKDSTLYLPSASKVMPYMLYDELYNSISSKPYLLGQSSWIL